MKPRPRDRSLRLRVRAARRPNPLVPLVVLALLGVLWLLAGPARAADPELPALAPSEVTERTGADGALLLDVRTDEEWQQGHVPGARQVPIQELPERMGELEAWRDRGVVVYCESGRRAAKAADLLREAGFSDVSLLDGSMARWRAEGRPVETPAPKP